jgi:hypothetical protein
MTGKYEGVHAFLFLYEEDFTPPEEVVEAIQRYISEDGPIFFASLFEGDFEGFVHVAADDLEQLVDFKDNELFDAGVRTQGVTEASVLTNVLAQPMGPKRQSPRFCAICRVRTTQKPATVLDAIAKKFNRDEPLVGASRVIGNFPVLVELGSDDRDALLSAIQVLLGVPGVYVEGTKIAIADTRPDGDRSSGA